jgi:hypothetical protein
VAVMARDSTQELKKRWLGGYIEFVFYFGQLSDGFGRYFLTSRKEHPDGCSL